MPSLHLEGFAGIGWVVHKYEGRDGLVVELGETRAGALEPVNHSLVNPILSCHQVTGGIFLLEIPAATAVEEPKEQLGSAGSVASRSAIVSIHGKIVVRDADVFVVFENHLSSP